MFIVHRTTSVQSVVTMCHTDQRSSRIFFNILDSVISVCLVGPLVISFWRGCWQLLDIYLFPDNSTLSVVTSGLAGIAVGLAINLYQRNLYNFAGVEDQRVTFFLFSRMYTLVAALASINQWRFVWMCWDLITGLSISSGILCTATGLVLLTLTKTVRNVIGPPLCLITDHRLHYFYVPNVFRVENDCCVWHFFDAFFTSAIIGSITCFTFRGIWLLMDAVLSPLWLQKSAWQSLLIGNTLVILMLLAQPFSMAIISTLPIGFRKLLLEDLYYMVATFSVVNVWRGIWLLQNIYIYPSNFVLSNWVTMTASGIILICMQCSNSLAIRGADMDGSIAGSDGVRFSVDYMYAYRKLKVVEKRLPCNASNLDLTNQAGTGHEQLVGEEKSHPV